MYTTLINTSELNEILNRDDLVLVDCRFSLMDTESGQRDYEHAHLPNAFYAHLDKDLSGEIIKGKTGRHPLPSLDKITALCSKFGIDATKQVVVYDQHHGGIAARLWFMLKWLGHENVAVLNGGWQTWIKDGFPTNNALPTTTPTHFQPQLQPDLMVSMAAVADNIETPTFTLIDARESVRYRGEIEPIDPVAGHIPSALSFPFLNNLDNDFLFLNQEKLKQVFENIIDKEVVVYCGSGVTACHNILALTHIGAKKVRLYPGSWSEWLISNINQ